jgi:hypothetical protein
MFDAKKWPILWAPPTQAILYNEDERPELFAYYESGNS